jgi:hypothetical protein
MTGTSNYPSSSPFANCRLKKSTVPGPDADKDNHNPFVLVNTDAFLILKTCMVTGYSALAKGKKWQENGVGLGG